MGGLFLCQWGRGKVALMSGVSGSRMGDEGNENIETIQKSAGKSETGRLLADYHSVTSIHYNSIYKWT